MYLTERQFQTRGLWLLLVLLSLGTTVGGCDSDIDANRGIPFCATLDANGRPTDGDGDSVCDGCDECANTPSCATVDANGCPTDGDGDSMYDGCDQCADTPSCATVDASGCPTDGDGDGVYNGCDQCADTPSCATVDAYGCPTDGDADGDGVYDGCDECANTPSCATVDASGCPSDGDGDGVYDGCDQCADTASCATVDASGCPSDGDGDSVYDGCDQCADTPSCATVDASGCPTDGDGDGVYNGCDQCADTPSCATVDAYGCPTDGDADGDGVYDGCDECASTPSCATVDASGCPTDGDGDGVHDGCDECANTPTWATVDANGCPTFGLAYGVFRQHERPEGLQPTLEEIREDLDILEAILPPPRRVRIYSATHGSGLAAIEAAKRGFEVTLGAWIGEDAEANRKEIQALIEIANTCPLVAVLVGNEVLLRDDAPADALAGMIHQVRQAVPENVPVGTAEVCEIWKGSEGGVIADVSDILLVHVHPYWDGTPVEEAAESVFRQYFEVAEQYADPGKQVIIGETGWPSAGQTEKEAVPSPENQHLFLRDFSLQNAELGIEAFFFSAFDEPWKGTGDRDPGEATATAGYKGNPIEGDTGAHWGVFFWNRIMKPDLTAHFPEPPIVDCSTATLNFVVFTQGMLSPGHDMGVDSSSGHGDWVVTSEYLRFDYPAGECWGSAFLTVGEPLDDIPRPDFEDLSRFGWLAFEARGEMGGEVVEVAVKDCWAPDDGTEPKVRVSGLETEWRTVAIPMSHMEGMDLTRLYVPVAFNFFGADPQTVFVRNIQYIPAECPVTPQLEVSRVVRPTAADGHVFVEGCVGRWYVMGVDTSEEVRDWVNPIDGALRLSYPSGQQWGAMFIAFQELTPVRPRPHYQDFSSFGRLVFEARGEHGGEIFDVGAKDRYAPDTGQETKITIGPLSTSWAQFTIHIDEFVGTEFGELYVPFEAVFDGSNGRTVFIRNVRYEP